MPAPLIVEHRLLPELSEQLDLLRPIYSKTTNYGHFGKEDSDITWEKTDKVAALKKAIA